MTKATMNGTCDVCSGAIPTGEEVSGHTAVCAEVVRQRGERYRLALERIRDMMSPENRQQFFMLGPAALVAVYRVVDDALSHQDRETPDSKRDRGREVTFVRGGEIGWVRIGRYDNAERRSLWCRVVGEDNRGVGEPAIELCSGREGDDAYVRIDSSNPQWANLCDVLLRVEGDCGLPVPCSSQHGKA